MQAKLKHLEFIQGVINRLTGDSFRIQGWAVVLVSALSSKLGSKRRFPCRSARRQVIG